MRIFAEALNNFEQHGSKAAIGQHDFGDFIAQVWKYVPSAVVIEAINKALDEAKSKESHSHYSMASAKSGIALKSHRMNSACFSFCRCWKNSTRTKRNLCCATTLNFRRN